MFGLSVQELMVLGVVAVLLFGKRLPDVAKSIGASYRDFRKGLTEIQSQMDLGDSIYRPGRYTAPKLTSAAPKYGTDDADDCDRPTAPKFELPTAAEPSSDAGQNAVD